MILLLHSRPKSYRIFFHLAMLCCLPILSNRDSISSLVTKQPSTSLIRVCWYLRVISSQKNWWAFMDDFLWMKFSSSSQDLFLLRCRLTFRALFLSLPSSVWQYSLLLRLELILRRVCLQPNGQLMFLRQAFLGWVRKKCGNGRIF